MPDILETASDWLEGKRHELRTVPVEYQRGAETITVQATVGRTMFEIVNAFGILERIESRDYLIRTEDLVLGGGPELPDRGDRVRETRGDTVFIYEVMAPSKEPHYRYSDPYRKTLRVHTKQVGTEAAP